LYAGPIQCFALHQQEFVNRETRSKKQNNKINNSMQSKQQLYERKETIASSCHDSNQSVIASQQT